MVTNFACRTSNIREFNYFTAVLYPFFEEENFVYTRLFQEKMRYVRDSHLNIIDKADIEEEVAREKEDASIKQNMRTKVQLDDPGAVVLMEEEDENGYSLIEGLIIVSAYCASKHPESEDLNHFSYHGAKHGGNKSK